MPFTDTEPASAEQSSPVQERLRARYETDEDTGSGFRGQRPYFHADDRAKWYNTPVARQALPVNANAAILLVATVLFAIYVFQDIHETKAVDRAQFAQLATYASAISTKASKADLTQGLGQVNNSLDQVKAELTQHSDKLERSVMRSVEQIMDDHRAIKRQFAGLEGQVRQVAALQQKPQVSGTVTPTSANRTAAPAHVTRPNPQYVIPMEPPARDSGGAVATTAPEEDKAASFPVPPGVVASKASGKTQWHVFPNNGRGDEIVTPIRQVTVGTRGTGFEVRTQSGWTCVLSMAGQWVGCSQ